MHKRDWIVGFGGVLCLSQKMNVFLDMYQCKKICTLVNVEIRGNVFFFPLSFSDELKKQLEMQRRQRAAHGKIKLTIRFYHSKT